MMTRRSSGLVIFGLTCLGLASGVASTSLLAFPLDRPLVPRLESWSHPVGGTATRESTVLSLRLFRGPADIARRVAALVPEAINRVISARPAPHVGEKHLETLPPAATDRDPAPAVVLPLRRSWIRAASNHPAPGDIFRRAACAPRLAVGNAAHPTTTGLDGSASQAVDVLHAALPAPAPTGDTNLAVSHRLDGQASHDQMAESLPDRRSLIPRLQRPLEIAAQAPTGPTEPAREALNGRNTLDSTGTAASDIPAPMSTKGRFFNDGPTAKSGTFRGHEGGHGASLLQTRCLCQFTRP